ncbi:ABC transporter substrate-binding protein [Hydrogenoanaerobacterium saccharovorans]|uniref:ABC transporter substrate-binding protein n=1 Tax=Hydrogenoanaerobacterium saccharovorans TaxID=474960 RepID=A0ABS2GNQ5_9FIRM|nr:ABC transporter substrate-binding protein [Hydrogenoanaerobacterium saccharovorans]MBM6923448.1 ABC transporter substrate-binding protein [Hydrogenoanaerobacterium saccharovorans]MBS5634769.1 ABC transporter substrate-binding protein [Clostridiales bacterium]
MKRTLALLMASALMLSLAGCSQTGGSSSSGEAETLRIGIIQPMEHESLDAAREGFVQALADHGYIDGDTIVLDYQNAQGDSSALLTISQRFVGDDCDLVLAIGTGAAQSIASQTSEIPVLITAVTDPVDAGLVQSSEAPGTNVTGTNDMNPIREQLELIPEILPDAQTVGLLYTSSEDNSILQIEEAKAILEEMNLDYVEQTVTGSNDVQQAVQSIVTRCDAIYIPTDNTFASAMPLVGSVVMESGTPVICGATGMVEAGGLITLGLNYYNLGYQTGEMAAQVLEGADPASMPVQSQNQYDYVVNEEMLSALGMELPQSLLEKMGDAA